MRNMNDLEHLSTEDLLRLREELSGASSSFAALDDGADLESLSTDELLAMRHTLGGEEKPQQQTQPQDGDSGYGRHIARTAKDVAAGLAGAVPDLASAAYNLPALGINYAAGTNLPLIPSVTSAVSEGIDSLTGGYTAPQGEGERAISAGIQFVGGLPGGGPVGKGISSLAKGAASGSKLASAGQKVGDVLQKGSTINATNVASSFGAGAVSEIASDTALGGFGGALLGGFLGDAAVRSTARGAGHLKEYAQGKGPEKYLAAKGKDVGRRLAPTEIMARRAQAEELGVDLSLGELTESPTYKGIEDQIHNSRQTEVFDVHNEKNIDALKDSLNEELSATGKGQHTDYTFGDKTKKAFLKTREALLEKRSKQAKADFGEVERLSRGKAVIKIDNFKAALKQIIKENTSELSSPIQDQTRKEAQAWLDKIEKKKNTSEQRLGDQLREVLRDKTVDDQMKMDARNLLKQMSGKDKTDVHANDLQKALGFFTGEAASSGKFFKDLDTASERRYATILKEGLMKDLDIAASESKKPAQALALKKARDNYRKNSEALDKVADSVIGRFLDEEHIKSPEEVAKKIVAMTPSHRRETIKMLSTVEPGLIKDARRYYIDKAIEAATEDKGLDGKEFSFAKFQKAMPKDEVLEDLFQGDAEALGRMYQIAAVMDRLKKHRPEYRGSPTQPRMEIDADISKAGLTKKVLGWFEKMINNRALNKEQMAQMMVDPEMQDAVFKRIYETKQKGPVVYISAGQALRAAAQRAGDNRK